MSLGEGNGTPLQYFCLENPMIGGAWSAAVHGVTTVGHDWATSLSLFTFVHWRRRWQPTPVFLPGESQGREVWWAAVYGVAQSRTRLKQCRARCHWGRPYESRQKGMGQPVCMLLTVILLYIWFDILHTDYGDHLVKHLAISWNLGYFFVAVGDIR